MEKAPIFQASPPRHIQYIPLTCTHLHLHLQAQVQRIQINQRNYPVDPASSCTSCGFFHASQSLAKHAFGAATASPLPGAFLPERIYRLFVHPTQNMGFAFPGGKSRGCIRARPKTTPTTQNITRCQPVLEKLSIRLIYFNNLIRVVVPHIPGTISFERITHVPIFII